MVGLKTGDLTEATYSRCRKVAFKPSLSCLTRENRAATPEMLSINQHLGNHALQGPSQRACARNVRVYHIPLPKAGRAAATYQNRTIYSFPLL